jgi:hypothetical protein
MHEEYLGTLIERCYSKSDYKAVLTYEEGILGKTFSIGVSWGIEICV